MRRNIRWNKADEGMTLIELIVTMLLSVIVLGILATMIVGVYQTQTSVGLSTNASSQAQVASDSFRSAIRSSTATSLSTSTTNGLPSQLLISRSLSAKEPNSMTPAARCVAFLWVSGNPGSLFWASAASRAALPSSSATAGWTELVSSAQAQDSTNTVFYKSGLKHQLIFTAKPAAGPATTLRVGVLAPKLKVEQWGSC